jgi:serine/threonine-protein kinase
MSEHTTELLVRRASVASDGPTRDTLPPDVVSRAAHRIGTAALVYAAAFPVANVPAWLTDPEAVAASFGWTDTLYLANTASAIVCSLLGLAFYTIVRAGWLSDAAILQLGRLFLVLSTLGIALPTHLAEGVPLGAGTWVCVWLVAYATMVPSRAGQMLATLLVASLAPPAVVALGGVMEFRPVPDAATYVFVALPVLLCAVVGAIMSRIVYRLGVDVQAARELGAYRLVERLGHGGMGEVWLAEHRLLSRPAAVKLIRADTPWMLSRDPDKALRRFEREAQATAALTSPHTVRLFDFGVADDGTFYYVMEHLEGIDLERAVERFGPLPAERVCHILEQVAASLAEAHEDGLVHRDVKPANLFLCHAGVEYDFVKVLDFGLVKTIDSLREPREGKRSSSGDDILPGTPAYMAPELVSGEVTPAADVYALGCVGCFLLTGQTLFQGDTVMAIVSAHINLEPEPPSARTELEVPADLEALLMRCLAKRPEDRPASAAAILEQLRSCAHASGWTRERARAWWQKHLPEEARHAATHASLATLR